MERGTKRKAALAASPPVERSAKRQKTPVPESQAKPANGETREQIRDTGLKYVARVRDARDKADNLIAVDFLTLPSRTDFPEYYAYTALPIAVDTIEEKVKDGRYPSIAALEGDAKRMIQNAKDYNEPGSEIHANAERLRKITFNFMKQNNPSYTRDKNYVSQPTPLPRSEETPSKATGKIRLKSARDDSNAPRKTEPPAMTEKMSTPATAPDAVLSPDADGYLEGFEGKTFQQAQEQIVNEMLKYQEEGGDFLIFQPFIYLPSRSMKDYYALIKEPMSLSKVQKKVQGIHGARGKESATNQTEFRSWDAFETEIAKIWMNARTFNEDGSDMYQLSQELEEYFKGRLEEAKESVSEPPQPTLKLNLSKSTNPPIKLRFGSQKESPAPAAAGRPRTPATPGVAIDEAALQRQKEAVKSGANGGAQAPTASAASSSRPSSQAGPVTATSAFNGVKAETSGPISMSTDPQRHASSPSHQSSLSGPPRMVNGTSHATPYPYSTHSQATSSSNFDNKFRAEGKDATSALLTSLLITTHPSLQLPPPQKPLFLDLPASDTLTQQSVTLNLPAQQTHLQLFPTVNRLVALNRNRPYRVFVTANGVRLNPSSTAKPPASTASSSQGVNGINGTSSTNEAASVHNGASDVNIVNGHNGLNGLNGLNGHQDSGPPPQGYDIRLNTGMNRIEVECVAVAEGALGAGTLAGKGGLEMERWGVFACLLRG